MEGWIKLHRQIFNNPYWLAKPFSKGQAWVDLILLANHEKGFFYCRDHKITVQRGEVGMSQSKLSERWGWSRKKVKKFLNDLEKEHQVLQQVSKSYSTIQIVNYEKYQKKEHQGSHQRPIRGSTNKNDKEGLSVVRPKKTLYRNSKYCDNLSAIKTDIGEKYHTYNLYYYNELVKNWSDSGSKLKVDWLATIRNFILGDIKEGKVRMNS